MCSKVNPSEILTAHELLNAIYSKAQEFHSFLNERGIGHKYGFYPKNYLKINGKQCLQEYPIPVCSFEKGGDIGFNLDGIFFEFFVDKKTLEKAIYKTFFNPAYRTEIYGAEHCMIDFLFEDDTAEKFLNKLRHSNEKTFGVSFYYHRQLSSQDLYREFVKKSTQMALRK